MGPFELMDLIGARRQPRGHQERVGGLLPRSALHAVGAAAGAGRGGLPRPQVGARLLRLRAGCAEAAAATEAPQAAPPRIGIAGDGPAGRGSARRASRPPAFDVGALPRGCGGGAGATSPSDDALLVPSDGRTATARRRRRAGSRTSSCSTSRYDYAHVHAAWRSRAPTPAADAGGGRGHRRAAGRRASRSRASTTSPGWS